MEQIFLNYDNDCDAINTERLKNKKIKDFITYQNTDIDRYIVIIFEDDTYIAISLSQNEEDNDINFSNIDVKLLLTDFYNSPDNYIYTKYDGTIVYPEKIKKLMDAGLINADENLAEYLKNQAIRNAKIEDYKKYLLSEFKFNTSFAQGYYNFEQDYNYFVMSVDDIRQTLSKMEFISPIGMIITLAGNCDYDPYTFSLDIEMSNKALIQQYNPYTTWYMYNFDIQKQWGVKNFPKIDPVKLVTSYVDNGNEYHPGDTEQVKNWKLNHRKLFPYSLITQAVELQKAGDCKYKLSDEKIEEIISKWDRLKIYSIYKQ